MKHINFTTSNVCARQIDFDIDENDCIGIAGTHTFADICRRTALVKPEACNVLAVSVVDLADQVLEKRHPCGIVRPAHPCKFCVANIVGIVRRQIQHERNIVRRKSCDQLGDHVGRYGALVRTSGALHGF